MKKTVIANWLNQGKDPNVITVNSFEQLLMNYTYIGFIPSDHEDYIDNKYIVITGGSARGFAISPIGAWTTRQRQPEISGTYFIFDYARELYEWLLQ